MPRPLVIYDGECKFCRQQLRNLQRAAGRHFQAASFRESGFFEHHKEVSPDECQKALQFIDAAGRKFSGAEAVVRILALNRLFCPLTCLYYIPGIRKLCNVTYENISLNRYKISRWRWVSTRFD
jgi:predicted DCC family thiol-disulfide oxidoreductase YuxK